MTPCRGRVELVDHISRMLIKIAIERFPRLETKIFCSKEHDDRRSYCCWMVTRVSKNVNPKTHRLVAIDERNEIVKSNMWLCAKMQ